MGTRHEEIKQAKEGFVHTSSLIWHKKNMGQAPLQF